MPRSPKTYFLAGLACLVVAIGIVAVSTILVVREWFPAMTFPVREFDVGTQQTIEVPDDPRTRLVLSMLVEERDEKLPPIRVNVRGDEGQELETGKNGGWATLLGRTYRRVLDIDPGDADAILIEVEETPGLEYADFAIFRHPFDVGDHYSKSAMPWWVTGFVLGVVAVVLLVAGMVRSGARAESTA